MANLVSRASWYVVVFAYTSLAMIQLGNGANADGFLEDDAVPQQKHERSNKAARPGDRRKLSAPHKTESPSQTEEDFNVDGDDADASMHTKKSAMDTLTNCDQSAGYRFDMSLPKGVSGVEFKDIDISRALKACMGVEQEDPSNARSAFELGRVYHADKQPQKARYWYRRAMELGSNAARDGLASILSMSTDPEDLQSAYNLYKTSASIGSARGLEGLGYLYISGKYVSKDYDRAFELFERSSQRGYYPATWRLGRLVRDNDRDYENAIAWFDKAEAQRSARSYSNNTLEARDFMNVNSQRCQAADFNGPSPPPLEHVSNHVHLVTSFHSGLAVLIVVTTSHDDLLNTTNGFTTSLDKLSTWTAKYGKLRAESSGSKLELQCSEPDCIEVQTYENALFDRILRRAQSTFTSTLTIEGCPEEFLPRLRAAISALILGSGGTSTRF